MTMAKTAVQSKNGNGRGKRPLLFFLIVIPVLNALLILWTAQNEAKIIKNNLAKDAYWTALGLNVERFKAFDATTEERKTPEYARMYGQISQIVDLHPAWDGCFLIKRRVNGEIYFLMDIRSSKTVATRLDYGQVFDECPPEIAEIFSTAKGAVVGPYQDAFGTWVTALVPVVNPADGTVMSLMGIDLRQEIYHGKIWGEVKHWVGFSVAMLAVLVVWILLAYWKTRTGRKLNYLEAISTFMIGVAISFLLLHAFRHIDEANVRAEFLSLASRKARTLVECVKTVRDTEISMLSRYFSIVQKPEPAMVGEMATQFGTIPEERFWCWAPVVTDEARQNFERQETEAGRVEFRITEQDAQGKLVPALPRGSYSPVTVVVPNDAFRTSGGFTLGFDLGTNPDVVEVMKEADRTFLPCSSRVVIADDDQRVDDFQYIVQAVADKSAGGAIKGHLVSILEPQKLLDTVFCLNADRNNLIHAALVLKSGEGDAVEVIATTSGHDVFGARSIREMSLGRFFMIQPCVGFGRTYAMVVQPTAEFMALYSGNYPVLVFGLGLVLSILLAFVVHTDVHLRDNLQALVEQSTLSLRKTVEQYERMGHNSMAFSAYIMRDGTWRGVSNSVAGILGYSSAELEGRMFYEFFPASAVESERAKVFEMLRFCDRTYTHKHPLVAKNGEVRWFVSHLVPEVHEETGERCLQVTTSDVTEEDEAERSLKESRRQYASLIANIPGIVFRCKFEKTWPMEFISDGSLEVFGYEPDDFYSGRITYSKIIEESYRDVVWATWKDVLAEQGVFSMEYGVTAKDGEKKWVIERGAGVYDSKGRVVALEGFIFDITKRKKAERDRERFAMAMEQLRDAVVITNENGVILYANSAIKELAGFDKKEVIGTIMPTFESPPIDSDLYHSMWKTLYKGKTWESHFPGCRKDGTTYTENVVISPVLDDKGKVVNFVSIRHDISGELQDSAERDSLREQLNQANKMESIGRLAGGVAHDFNNMLQAILGYSEMALAQLPPESPVHADVTSVQSAARRAADLTRQLLIFARKSKSEPKVIGISSTIANLSSLLKRVIGSEVVFVWNPPEGEFHIRVDPTQFDQVVANLCLNARDAVAQKEEGRVVLSARPCKLNAPLKTLLGELPSGDYVILSVLDNGCGITDENRTRLFEPFFTTKGKGKGTGLGLSTAYGVVKSCNGGIVVKSKVGEGSSFELFFPLASREVDGPVEVVKTAKPQLPKAKSNEETILLVDDEVTILYTTKRMLESLGYKVLSTMSPLEALEIAKEYGSKLSLLLSDVIMPEINGPEMVRRILVDLPNLPYLYMSGYTANLLSEHGLSKSGFDVILKPFTRADLAVKIRAGLDGALEPTAHETVSEERTTS